MNSDLINNMMKIDQNRICADCYARDPLIINLAFRTFICEDCANIHVSFFRKYNKPEMTKGIIFAPSSSLSAREIKRMQHVTSGNEAANATYLALYKPFDKNAHPRPNVKSSLTLRKSWIFHKYVKKQWYKNPVANNERSGSRIMSTDRDNLIGDKSLLQSLFNMKFITSYSKNVISDMNLQQMRTQPSYSHCKQNEGQYKRSNKNIVSELMSLPPNRKCVDCATKSPNFVNMSHGTFLCKQCAPFHEELSYKVVEVGRYDFTTEDIFRLKRKDAGNAYINASYLRLYDPLKHVDTPPTRESRDNLRMAWITKKYGFETWYQSMKPKVGDDVASINMSWLQTTPFPAITSTSFDKAHTGLQSCFEKRNIGNIRVTFKDLNDITSTGSRIDKHSVNHSALKVLPSRRIKSIGASNLQRQNQMLVRNLPASEKSKPTLRHARSA